MPELKAKITADATNFSKTLSGLNKKITGFVKSSAKALGVGAVVGFIASTREALKFSKGMAEVRTITPMAKKELKDFKTALIDLSNETGQTRDVLVKGLYQALSAGVPKENALAFLETASKSAIAGISDTETAVDGLTSVLNAYNMDASKAGEVSDLFFETVRLGKTTFSELSQNIGQVAPLAKASGVSVESLFASIASLTKQGFKTDIAITAIRGSLTGLLKPTDKLQTQLDKITKAEGVANWQSLGFQKTMDLLSKSVNGSASEMAEMFPNVRGLNGVLAMTGDGATGAAKDLEALSNASGATAKAFAIMDAETSSDIDRLIAVAKNLGAELGETALPLIQNELQSLLAKAKELRESGDIEKFGKQGVAILKDLLEKIKALAAFLAKHQGAIKTLGITYATINILGKARTGVLALTKAMTALNAAKAAGAGSNALAAGGLALAAPVLVGAAAGGLGYYAISESSKISSKKSKDKQEAIAQEKTSTDKMVAKIAEDRRLLETALGADNPAIGKYQDTLSKGVQGVILTTKNDFGRWIKIRALQQKVLANQGLDKVINEQRKKEADALAEKTKTEKETGNKVLTPDEPTGTDETDKAQEAADEAKALAKEVQQAQEDLAKASEAISRQEKEQALQTEIQQEADYLEALADQVTAEKEALEQAEKALLKAGEKEPTKAEKKQAKRDAREKAREDRNFNLLEQKGNMRNKSEEKRFNKMKAKRDALEQVKKAKENLEKAKKDLANGKVNGGGADKKLADLQAMWANADFAKQKDELIKNRVATEKLVTKYDKLIKLAEG